MERIFTRGLMSFLLSVDEHGRGTEHGSGGIKEYVMHHVKDQVIYPLHIGNFDISITKHVLMLWIAAAILIIFIPLAFRSKTLIPKGPANLIEAIVVYLKETIIDPYLGSEAFKYAPYLLTAFFFIITCNLLGLIPMGATATGNISVTISLALSTLFLVQFSNILKNGFKGYIKSFVPSGIPSVMVPLIFAVEFLGMLTKHVALAIRLFANMFAGHLVIFTIMGLIFLFKNIFIAPFPILGIVFVSLLELLIALIQAYIFTILSAVFIGMGLSSHH
ncbi:F0F1 ATP synthase subunit A [candidate division KSB1 bacterium]|nr:F0F1 ATP synthase subunit A [candidate division KSB1 bacterium]MBL7093114.1 F0F1 ATP synthase subunit A [candidate division KSB1 bacterium]